MPSRILNISHGEPPNGYNYNMAVEVPQTQGSSLLLQEFPFLENKGENRQEHFQVHLSGQGRVCRDLFNCEVCALSPLSGPSPVHSQKSHVRNSPIMTRRNFIFRVSAAKASISPSRALRHCHSVCHRQTSCSLYIRQFSLPEERCVPLINGVLAAFTWEGDWRAGFPSLIRGLAMHHSQCWQKRSQGW